MLADPRSDQLVINFAGQWLSLRALPTQIPVTAEFPDFDDNLRQAMRKETEMFVDSIVHEDRPRDGPADGQLHLPERDGWPSITESRASTAAISAAWSWRRNSTCGAACSARAR